MPGIALDKAADGVQALAPRNAKASLLRHKAAMLRSDFLQARDALHQYFDLSSTGSLMTDVCLGTLDYVGLPTTESCWVQLSEQPVHSFVAPLLFPAVAGRSASVI